MACGLAVVCTCQIDVASAAAGAARSASAAEVTARSVLASGIRFEFTRPPGRLTFGYEYGRGLQRAIRELSKQRLRTYGHPRIGAITFTAPGRRGLVSSSRRNHCRAFPMHAERIDDLQQPSRASGSEALPRLSGKPHNPVWTDLRTKFDVR